MNLSSETPLHTKFEISRSKLLSESSQKTLVRKILQKICVIVKLFIFYIFLIDTAQRQTLSWSSELKMSERKSGSWDGLIPDLCLVFAGQKVEIQNVPCPKLLYILCLLLIQYLIHTIYSSQSNTII